MYNTLFLPNRDTRTLLWKMSKRSAKHISVVQPRKNPYDSFAPAPDVLKLFSDLFFKYNILAVPEFELNRMNAHAVTIREKQKIVADPTLIGSVSYFSSRATYHNGLCGDVLELSPMELIISSRAYYLNYGALAKTQEEQKKRDISEYADTEKLKEQIFTIIKEKYPSLEVTLEADEDSNETEEENGETKRPKSLKILNGYVPAKISIVKSDIVDSQGERVKKRRKTDNDD